MIFPWNFHHNSYWFFCYVLLLHYFHIFSFYCNWKKNDSCVFFYHNFLLHFIIFLAWHQFSSYFNLNGRKSIIVIIMFQTTHHHHPPKLPPTTANWWSDSQCFLWELHFHPSFIIIGKNDRKMEIQMFLITNVVNEFEKSYNVALKHMSYNSNKMWTYANKKIEIICLNNLNIWLFVILLKWLLVSKENSKKSHKKNFIMLLFWRSIKIYNFLQVTWNKVYK